MPTKKFFSKNKKDSSSKENSSLRKGPIILALLAIFLIFGAFFWKNQSPDNLDKLKQQLQERENVQLRQDIPILQPQDVFSLIRKKGYQLVDLREPGEFRLLHIESSLNAPFSRLEQTINQIDPQKVVILIDRENLPRTRLLANHLKEQGVDVRYFQGGILKYAQENYTFINFGNPDSPQDSLKVTPLTPQEIKERIASGEHFNFVDIRPSDAYQADHIQGSLNIPLEQLEDRKHDLPLGKILVYDNNPLRSFQAAVRLYDMNVMSVYNCTESYVTMVETLTAEKSNNPSESETETIETVESESEGESVTNEDAETNESGEGQASEDAQ